MALHKTPLLHITDLYHPPQDPDDHLDLLTIAGLPEFDLLGVVLDVTDRFLTPSPEGFDIPREPGFIPVIQLGHLTGRTIPMSVGPRCRLKDSEDDVQNRSKREQRGIDFLLTVLEEADGPVTITVVGSARIIAAAYNRRPDLVLQKTRVVALNAGTSGGSHREWNVQLDPWAYAALWQSGLSVDWYPCATERSPFDPGHERSAYWKTTHAALFENVPDLVRGWFSYAVTGSSRSDFIRAMSEMGRGALWQLVMEGTRHMWSTASIVMAAGRVLAETRDGWRFVPESDADDLTIWPWRLDPISVHVNDQRVDWQPTESSHIRLFGRRPDHAFGAAMAEALNALLKELSVD